MANLLQIIDDLDALTSAEKGELVTKLEEKWGVKSSYFSMSELMPRPPENAPVAEKTEFTVVLTGFASKVDVIKEIRKITGLGLKESKDFVEACPQVVKADIPKDEAEAIAGALRLVSGVVEVK